MATYDPKRPRPGAAAGDDDPAPVDALLGGSTDEPVSGPDGPDKADRPHKAAGTEGPIVSINGAEAATPARANGSTDPDASAQRVSSDVPVAPAPETGTTNRAVLIAAIGGTVVVAALLAVLIRRRRSRR